MGQATRASELRRLYRRWMVELWNGDLAVATELVTDDFVIHQARADGGGPAVDAAGDFGGFDGRAWLNRALEVLDGHTAPVGSG